MRRSATKDSRSFDPLETESLSDPEDPGSDRAWTSFTLRGRAVRARQEASGIRIQTPVQHWPAGLRCLDCFHSWPALVPYAELLAATSSVDTSWLHWLACYGRPKEHVLTVHTFRRSPRRRCHWHRSTLRLCSDDEEVVRSWAGSLTAAARESAARPQRLLVYLNPFGGQKKAWRVWATQAFPIFQLAGVECRVVETQHAQHAHDAIRDASLQELQSCDGILAVGGDGLFGEVLNGLMKVWCSGGERGAAAGKLRLGHIPAGSTDAVAFSLNGTRSATTAALHVALGDGMRVDSMRVDSAGGEVKAAVCYAAYGYMGDLMHRSESMRVLGPLRYQLSGAITLLLGRSYAIKVSYVPAPPLRDDMGAVPCKVGCGICANSILPSGSLAGLGSSSSSMPAGAVPVVKQGSYKSCMVIVTPCRSDLSAQGLSPLSHLADGRLTLALVRQCSVLEYLRFLALIPRKGVYHGMGLEYVEVVEATWVKIEPQGPESHWNVDGELLANKSITAAVHRGVVPVFARGVED